jgi:SAM-dependent methyltransferase
MSDAEWDERYASTERVWSGQPNLALVAEVTAMTPGRVLDVGCGEGADAVWLAARGWQVTALDVSRVALERAAVHARDAEVDVEWVHAGLVEARLPGGAYDLVTVHYPALLRTPGRDAERSLLATVAPGGVLLVVHHAMVETHDDEKDHEQDSAFDPADYVSHTDLADFLGPEWQVEVDETRPRRVTAGAGAHHTHDDVLRARRLR